MSCECIVFGCSNKKHEGVFIGDMCAPCHSMLTAGRRNPSGAWFEQRINSLEQENAELKRWNANLKTENFKLSVESQTILEHCKDLERIIAKG